MSNILSAGRAQLCLLPLIAQLLGLPPIVVWRLDRWGRSLVDLTSTLTELSALGVGFVSLTEAIDLTTPTGRALAGMLAVFAEFEREILRERVKAGIAQARQRGKRHGRPPTVAHYAKDVQDLYAKGMSKSAIARQLDISRTSVRRLIRCVRRVESLLAFGTSTGSMMGMCLPSFSMITPDASDGDSDGSEG